MQNTAKIRELNDNARRSLTGIKVVATAGVAALPGFADILDKVRRYNEFEPGNDPHGEHDFGAFMHNGEQLFWKIDYYTLDLDGGSPDPADEALTRRVLAILKADEY